MSFCISFLEFSEAPSSATRRNTFFEAAVPFYDAERRARIIDLVKNIDAQPDVHALAKLLS